MNHFEARHTAERYAKGRPYFHPGTIKHIKDFLGPDVRPDKALDIACGTGLSAQALLDYAQRVYGTDASQEMLSVAAQPDKVSYAVAVAEHQPFTDHTFDLITVCSGVHWFDIDTFLYEAARLLKSKAWLILYDNFFLSEMMDVPQFHSWFPEVYLNKFPSPARADTYDWSNAHLNGSNLLLQKEEAFRNEVVFTKEELILYFTTQSNIASAVKSGRYSYAEIEDWLNAELTPFFEGHVANRTLYYGNKIQYLQKIS